ncbi:MAG TPA: hypothetical protein DCY74_01865 [Clostridiales bacterium]|nr:hypothetical protein [Clostridiales bacterium]
MLKRIIGPIGYGKTYTMESMIAQDLQKCKRVFYIVPEQHTVTAERSVLSLTGEPTRFLEIINFSRLPNLVFRELGGLSVQYIDKVGKRLLLASVLEEIKEHLHLYQNASLKPDFIEMLQTLNDEFLTKQVTPKTLLTIGDNSPSVVFSDKLKDLAMILATYSHKLESEFSDTTGDLYRLAETLKVNSFFEQTCIYLDGFYSYTAPEYALIRELLNQAEKVVMTFELPKDEIPDESSPFFTLYRTMDTVTELARKADVPVEDVTPAFSMEVHPSLRFITENLSTGQIYDKDGSAIHLFASIDRYAEVKEVARRIVSLVQEGARYRDIRVFMRNPADYQGILEPVFNMYQIPCSFQTQRSPLSHPLSHFLFSSLDMIFHTPALYAFQNLIKSGYTGIDAVSSFEIESYAMTWRISGSAYFSPFTMHPRGYFDIFEERDAAFLERVNSTRAQLMDPIEACKIAIKGKTVKETAIAVWQYIEDTGLFDLLMEEAESYKQQGNYTLAGELLTLWNAWIAALDQMVLVLGEAVIQDRFIEYLRLALSGITFCKLPSSLDEVEVGEIGFIRSEHPDHLFLLGVNEGIFPAISVQGGIFTPKERITLSEAGLDMEQGEFQDGDEWFKLYCALSAPKKTITLSYVTIDSSHNKLGDGVAYPSVFVDRICSAFPFLVTEQPNPDESIPLVPAEVMSLYRHPALSPESKQRIADEIIASKQEAYIHELSLFSALSTINDASCHIVDTSRFRDGIALTQARYDAYTKCPYSYYAKYLLGASEERKSDFGFTDVGNYLHRILEVFMTSLPASGKSFEAWTKEEIKKKLHTMADDYLNSLHIGDRMSARFKHLLTRLEKSLFLLITQLQEEFSVGQFVPVKFEMEIKDEQPPYTIQLEDGTEVRFFGKIDRVDLFTDQNGEAFIRIADYKSSVKTFSMHDIYYGFNIQLLVYLFAIWEKGFHFEDQTLPIVPAGVMYIPATREAVFTDHALSREEEMKESKKKDQRDGLFLKDETILKAMEPSLAGKFIPVTLKPSGELDGKKLATAAAFGKLKKHIEHTIKQIAGEIKAGNMEANPNISAFACDYCPYIPMCKNTEQKGRYFKRIGKEEDILKQLEQEGESWLVLN